MPITMPGIIHRKVSLRGRIQYKGSCLPVAVQNGGKIVNIGLVVSFVLRWIGFFWLITRKLFSRVSHPVARTSHNK